MFRKHAFSAARDLFIKRGDGQIPVNGAGFQTLNSGGLAPAAHLLH
jgi:hypothetical protein